MLRNSSQTNINGYNSEDDMDLNKSVYSNKSSG